MRQWEHFIAIIKKEVQPALGCTEPTSIAYAAAHAARLLGKKPERLSVAVSDNLYKNAMGVFVPGTGQIGSACPLPPPLVLWAAILMPALKYWQPLHLLM